MAPEFVIHPKPKAVQAELDGFDDSMERCAVAGLELRYQFEFKICQKRNLWWDKCSAQKSERNSVRYDPISEMFTVFRDRLQDGIAPSTVQYDTLQDAIAAAGRVVDIPFQYLVGKEKGLTNDKPLYVKARVISYCKEEFNRTLSAVAGVLTLGFVQLDRFDSGWKELNIPPSPLFSPPRK